jgi:hypothetical protein
MTGKPIAINMMIFIMFIVDRRMMTIMSTSGGLIPPDVEAMPKPL